MFKKQNKNYKNKSKIIKNIAIIAFLFLFFINFSFWFEISLKNSLDKLQNTIKRNSGIKIWGKAIIDDIYKTSLNKIQINNINPLLSATSKTVEHINTKYKCQMNDEEIIDILYFANPSFKNELKNNLDDFEKPSKNSLWINCNKLNTCISRDLLKPWQVFKNTVSSNKSCQELVENTFLKLYMDSYYNENIWKQIMWTDAFWNNDLDDSNYDLLNDVFMLGKILFQEMKKPAKILFFSMPTIGHNNVYKEPKINMTIDRFSPYNIFYSDDETINIEENSWASAQENLWNNLWANLIQIDIFTWNLSISWEIDNSIKGFIDSVNINSNNPYSSFIGNQCVSGFESEEYSVFFSNNWQSQSVAPEEYLESIIEEIEDLNCNNDGICQNRESNSCPDCKTTSYDTNDPSSFEEIQTILENAIENWDEILEDDPVLGCLQECSLLSCKTTDCPKLTCYAKCLCQTYSFDTNQLNLTNDNTTITWLNKTISAIGLSSDFSIKFCIIPAVWVESKNKNIYNIASIFSEINDVLNNLKNSWEMWINIKPKEFLESSKQENNFAKQASFSINSSTKPMSSNKSQEWIEKEQINLNTDLMEHILWLSKEYNTDKEKNKYVLIDDPCQHKISSQVSNKEEKDALLDSCKEESNMFTEANSTDINSAMIEQNVMLINNEFDNFMEKNRDFWYQTKLMFDELKNIAENLKNKK